MNKEIDDLPIFIYKYRDSRPEDTDAEPFIDDSKSTVSATFSRRQQQILAELLNEKGFTPRRFGVSTRHIYNEFRSPAHKSWLKIFCYGLNEKEEFEKLVDKFSNSRADYYGWMDAKNWVTEADLEAAKRSTDRD